MHHLFLTEQLNLSLIEHLMCALLISIQVLMLMLLHQGWSYFGIDILALDSWLLFLYLLTSLALALFDLWQWGKGIAVLFFYTLPFPAWPLVLEMSIVIKLLLKNEVGPVDCPSVYFTVNPLLNQWPVSSLLIFRTPDDVVFPHFS